MTSALRSPAEVRAEGNHLVGAASPYLEEHDHNRDLSLLATADALASRIEARFFDAERGTFLSGAGVASAGLPLSRRREARRPRSS